MKRFEEFSCVKSLLCEAIDTKKGYGRRTIEEIIEDILKIQRLDPNFIRNMLLLSDFYSFDGEVRKVYNFRAIDLKDTNICSFKLIPYEKLITKKI